MASLLARAYNPDVLSCIANLSNDEVFTPPELANRVLDMLPAELWSDPNVKVLDPFCKSGVFLREAAKRFIRGLEPVYPDLQERVDHIMHEQLYGIAASTAPSTRTASSACLSSMTPRAMCVSATFPTLGSMVDASTAGRRVWSLTVEMNMRAMPMSSFMSSVPKGYLI